MMGTTTTTTTTTMMNTGEFDDLSKSSNPFGFRTRSSSNHSSSSSSALEKQKDVKIGILCAHRRHRERVLYDPVEIRQQRSHGIGVFIFFRRRLGHSYRRPRRSIQRLSTPNQKRLFTVKLPFRKTCAKPALLTGLLWSAGNACSIIAISKLGVAIGWPLVQCQLVVSTTWGVWYYREVRGRKSDAGFASSVVRLVRSHHVRQFFEIKTK